eukprot:scaffold3852_cov402-Prasinococcus_capsulatus_cf.AAC.8
MFALVCRREALRSRFGTVQRPRGKYGHNTASSNLPGQRRISTLPAPKLRKWLIHVQATADSRPDTKFDEPALASDGTVPKARRRVSDETRRKISNAAKEAWKMRRSRKVSEETRAKMSKARKARHAAKGEKVTEDSVRPSSEGSEQEVKSGSSQGRGRRKKPSEETRAKMAAARREWHRKQGHRVSDPSSPKQYKLSAETRRKMSEAHKGKVYTPEMRQRVSEGRKFGKALREAMQIADELSLSDDDDRTMPLLPESDIWQDEDVPSDSSESLDFGEEAMADEDEEMVFMDSLDELNSELDDLFEEQMEQMEQVVFRRGVGRPRGSFKPDATKETVYRRRYYERAHQERMARKAESQRCSAGDSAEGGVESEGEDRRREEEDLLKQQYQFLGSKLRQWLAQFEEENDYMPARDEIAELGYVNAELGTLLRQLSYVRQKMNSLEGVD